jgi:hypothetical protein
MRKPGFSSVSIISNTNDIIGILWRSRLTDRKLCANKISTWCKLQTVNIIFTMQTFRERINFEVNVSYYKDFYAEKNSIKILLQFYILDKSLKYI